MFRLLSGLLGGPNPEKLLGHLPVDPAVDALRPISTSRRLTDGERAFLEIPAGWYRFRSGRRYGGVSVRVASGVYLKAGASHSDDPAPRLISNGTVVFTNHRVLFAGSAKSLSLPWEDVSEYQYGPDHMRFFRENGDTEIIGIREPLITWKDNRLGVFVWRLHDNWRKVGQFNLSLDALELHIDDAQKVLDAQSRPQPTSTIAPDLEDDVLRVIKLGEEQIARCLSAEELVEVFFSAWDFLDSFGGSFPHETLKRKRNSAKNAALRQTKVLLDSGACDQSQYEQLRSIIHTKHAV